MTLKIAISPCPNDTFIFENIYNGKQAIDGIKWQFTFLDIDELNNAALQQKFDVIKVSTAQLPQLTHNYKMLDAGGAMGYGVGPLLVCKQGTEVSNLQDNTVAIPGTYTTANFLLSYLYPQITKKTVALFSDIESMVLNNKVNLGVLIHEGRFTYKHRGLALVQDLGELWQQQEGLPIPLGCIVAKKSLGQQLINQIDKAIKNSICNYNNNGEPIISDFIKQHAQEMDEDVMLQHIKLYVNKFSLGFNAEGKLAINKLLQAMSSTNLNS